jgi:hypothetical protein
MAIIQLRRGGWLVRVVSLLAVAGAILAEGAVGARADMGVGSWSPTGALPAEGPLTVEGGGLAVVLADGRVLEVPGGDRDAELYDPTAGTWKQGPHRLQQPEGRWTLVALGEGGALLLGEAPCGGEPKECLPTTAVYRWDPGEPSWSSVAPLREARVDPVAVRLSDGRVLVAGGFGDNCPESEATNERYSCQPLSSAEIYDPASNEWSPTGPMPQPRGGAVGVLLSDGTVLVVGGDEERDAIRYDPGSGTWTAAAETARSRTGSLLFALPGDRALTLRKDPSAALFGSPPIREDTGENERPARQIGEGEPEPVCNLGTSSEIFSAALDAWTASLTVPAGGEYCPGFYGVQLAGGQIMLRADAGQLYYVLDTEQRCWSTTPPPLELHEGGEVIALSEGRALVFGGYGNDHWLTGAEIYTPGSPTCAPTAPLGPPTGLASSPPPPFAGATIAHHKHLTVTAAGSVRLLVQCPASAVGACVGHVRLLLVAATSTGVRSRNHTKGMFLGGAPFTMAAGKADWVTVRVRDHMRTLRAFIRRWGRATVVLATAAHDSAGQVVATSVPGTLRELRHPVG